MEPEAPDSPICIPALRERVTGGGFGQSRVKGRIEAGNVGNAGKRGLRGADRGDRDRVVKRRKLVERIERCHGPLVEERGLAEGRPAVDHAMSDGFDRLRPHPGTTQGGQNIADDRWLAG